VTRGGPASRLVEAWRTGALELVISDFVIDFMDTIGVRAELLRIDAAVLAPASAAGLAIPCCIA
jgi:hypothetical protein